jgi:hypothetical protein
LGNGCADSHDHGYQVHKLMRGGNQFINALYIV